MLTIDEVKKYCRDVGASVCVGTKSEKAQKVLDIMTEQMPPILKACPRVGKTLKIK